MSPYPADWNPDFDLSVPVNAALRDAVLNGQCGWVQLVTQLSFCLACLLLCCEDERERIATAEAMVAAIMRAARTGELPGETVQ